MFHTINCWNFNDSKLTFYFSFCFLQRFPWKWQHYNILPVSVHCHWRVHNSCWLWAQETSYPAIVSLSFFLPFIGLVVYFIWKLNDARVLQNWLSKFVTNWNRMTPRKSELIQKNLTNSAERFGNQNRSLISNNKKCSVASGEGGDHFFFTSPFDWHWQI